jgi:hypothetical protein
VYSDGAIESWVNNAPCKDVNLLAVGSRLNNNNEIYYLIFYISPMLWQQLNCCHNIMSKIFGKQTMLNRLSKSARNCRFRKLHARMRRGVAVLLVLLLITLTLALSYAAVRTQNLSFMVQRNSDRRVVAQQTAVTGMTMALKKMQDSSWAGFGSTLNGTLTTSESFIATYTFGDASLTSTSPDYNDYPFRGAISVTGKSVDPVNPQSITTYQISAVVRLVPRQTTAEPSDWATMNGYVGYNNGVFDYHAVTDVNKIYTVYQTYSQPFEIDIPCQFTGPVRIQGALKIAPHYPDNPGSDSWIRYLSDLYGMWRYGGYADYRPFAGPVSYVTGKMDANNINALITYLHSSTGTLALDEANSDWTQPNNFFTYQIYTGGPTYTIPTVSNNLQSVTLGPDPMTNPLGIFYYNGGMTILNDVTIKGSLFCKGSLTLNGNNIHFESVELPGLFGAGNSVRLPVIICNNLTVNNSVSSASIKGLVAVFSTLTIAKASQAQTISITGRVISKAILIRERQPWDTTNWPWWYSWYWAYYRFSIPYFPVYMSYSGTAGLNYQPLLTINPDTTSITYHWPTANASVFLVNPSDAALRWEVIKWSENP